MVAAFFKNIERTLFANLTKAKSEVLIAVAWMTNPRLFGLLNELNAKHVTVKLIVADDRINFTTAGKHFQMLLDNGIELRTTDAPYLMHHKFCIIDNRLLITGSYNWTLTAELRNFENIIVSTDRLLIESFSSEYRSLISKSQQLKIIELSRFKIYSSEHFQKEEAELIKESGDKTEEFTEEDDELPREVEELIALADIYYLHGKLSEALALCEQVLEAHPNVADAYEIIATCKWRQKKYKEQVDYAEKAVALDNEMHSAFNILGIGYSELGNAQKSIDSYRVCIQAEPEEHTYYRNRAASFLNLEQDYRVPKKLRDQFTAKADADLRTVIELTNAEEQSGIEPYYGLYFNRGVAKYYLNQLRDAENDLSKAKEIFQTTDRDHRDVHEFAEIKDFLRLAKRR